MGSFYLNDGAGLTGPWVCDGQKRSAVWINNWGRTVRFTQALNWLGVDQGGVGDVWFFVSRQSDGTPFTFLAWDHYRDPTATHQFLHTWRGSKNVEPGDGLVIEYFGQPTAKHAQIIIMVEYE